MQQREGERQTEGDRQKPGWLLPDIQPLSWGHSDAPPLHSLSPGSPLHTEVAWRSLKETTVTLSGVFLGTPSMGARTWRLCGWGNVLLVLGLGGVPLSWGGGCRISVHSGCWLAGGSGECGRPPGRGGNPGPRSSGHPRGLVQSPLPFPAFGSLPFVDSHFLHRVWFYL